MADTYSATLLQDAIYKASKKDTFQSFETRGSVYGALDAAVAQTDLLLPKSTVESIRKASGQTEKVNVFKKESNGTGTVRKCTGSGAGATAQVTLSWSTLAEEFSMSELQMSANQYQYAEIFQARFEERLKSLYKRIDSAIIAALEAAYTVGAGDSFGTFNDAFQVPLSAYDMSSNRNATWLNKVKADMMKNDFEPDMLEMVGDANLSAVLRSMLAQGNNTATNLAFQLEAFMARFSNRVSNNTGIYATGYAYQKGAFGLLTWTNELSRKGRDIGTDTWGTFIEPRYGLEIELKTKRACADNSADVTGAQADLTEGFVMAIDIATPFAYSSDSNSGIYKYELNEDDSVQSGSGSYV